MGDVADGEFVYIATLLNPKDHKPYAILWDMEKKRVFVAVPDEDEVDTVGEGYFETSASSDTVSATGCPRTHTPSGVAKEGVGLGLMLYSGMVLTATWASLLKAKEAVGYNAQGLRGLQAKCAASPAGNRSEAADRWWNEQVRRGFATETEGGGGDQCSEEETEEETEVEEDAENHVDAWSLEQRHDRPGEVRNIRGSLSGRISGTVYYDFCTEGVYNVISAEKVLQSGFVLHLNPRFLEDKSLSESWLLPPPKVIAGVDMTEVKSDALAGYVLSLKQMRGVAVDRQAAMPFHSEEDEFAIRSKEAKPYATYHKNPGEKVQKLAPGDRVVRSKGAHLDDPVGDMQGTVRKFYPRPHDPWRATAQVLWDNNYVGSVEVRFLRKIGRVGQNPPKHSAAWAEFFADFLSDNEPV